MLTPSTITLAQGQTGTIVISTTLVSGTAQLLSFDVTGLPPSVPILPPFNFSQAAMFTLNPPPGVKVSFAPPVVHVGTDVTMTLAVGGVTPGTYACKLVITGDQTPTQPVYADFTLVVTASTFSA